MSGEPTGSTLVMNAGSSSIKAALYGDVGIRLEAHVEIHDDGMRLVIMSADGGMRSDQAAGPGPWAAAIDLLFERLMTTIDPTAITAVGHRIVHGGTHFTAPTVVTPAVLASLDTLVPLAPLHQPQGLAALRGALVRLPGAVQVACFDTSFHHDCPPEAVRFAIPREFHDAGIRRYGFHGLSYESVTGRLPAVVRSLPERVIIAHLGAGASLCAIRDGKSVATTMGYTPLDGLVMATRCGSLDPGVVLHLGAERGMTPAAITTLLSRDSGLLGVSGISGDMRRLLESDDPRAEEAVALFCYRDSGDRVTRCRPRRPRCARLHRGHRRAGGRHPQPHRGGANLARGRSRRCGQPGPWPAHQHGIKPPLARLEHAKLSSEPCRGTTAQESPRSAAWEKLGRRRNPHHEVRDTPFCLHGTSFMLGSFAISSRRR